MGYITYHELVELFGHKAAYALLRVIEEASKETTNVIPLNREARLQRALDALGREPLAA